MTREWNRLAAEAGLTRDSQRQALKETERQISNLVDAIADGLRTPGLQAKLDGLEARRVELAASLIGGPPVAPALPPDLEDVYRTRVTALQEAISSQDTPEALEAARALIDRVVVHPPEGPDDPPRIDLCGHLMAMLQAGGANLPREGDHLAHSAIHAFTCSTKAGLGGWGRLYRTRC